MDVAWTVEVVDKAGGLERTTLSPNSRLAQIGSAEGNDVVLPPDRGRGVAPRHLQLIAVAAAAGALDAPPLIHVVNLVDQSQVQVILDGHTEGKDLKSGAPVEMTDGARIRVGEFELTLRLPMASPAEPEVDAKEDAEKDAEEDAPQALLDPGPSPLSISPIKLEVHFPESKMDQTKSSKGEPVYRLSLDEPLEGEIVVHNRGDEVGVQFDLDSQELKGCWTIGSGLPVYPGGKQVRSLRLTHSGRPDPPHGVCDFTIHAKAKAKAYPGQTDKVTTKIDVASLYRYESSVTKPATRQERDGPDVRAQWLRRVLRAVEVSASGIFVAVFWAWVVLVSLICVMRLADPSASGILVMVFWALAVLAAWAFVLRAAGVSGSDISFAVLWALAVLAVFWVLAGLAVLICVMRRADASRSGIFVGVVWALAGFATLVWGTARIQRQQRDRFGQDYELELCNTGNLTCSYELRAEVDQPEDRGALDFQWEDRLRSIAHRVDYPPADAPDDAATCVEGERPRAARAFGMRSVNRVRLELLSRVWRKIRDQLNRGRLALIRMARTLIWRASRWTPWPLEAESSDATVGAWRATPDVPRGEPLTVALHIDPKYLFVQRTYDVRIYSHIAEQEDVSKEHTVSLSLDRASSEGRFVELVLMWSAGLVFWLVGLWACTLI